MTRPSRRTGIVSVRTGTSSRHSGSPSRSSRPSTYAASTMGRRPAGRKEPSTSSTYAVGPVVGRICPAAQKPVPSRSGTQSTRSAKLRSAMICQSAWSSWSHCTSSSSRSACSRTSSMRVATRETLSPGVFGRMALMPGSYWKQVHASGLAVPSDRPLDDLTAELTRMLGDTDPETRDGTAYPTLATWVERGVYDDLLVGLGDGMAAGLGVGLGERETDSVFRRSFSALVLGECIGRDNKRPLVAGHKVLDWGDRIATWLLRERDLRGFVPGKGWAHAVAHGADALGTLANSPHVAANELTVVLDVIADRVLLPDRKSTRLNSSHANISYAVFCLQK